MLVCDVCMKPIADTRRANTVWFEEIESLGDECLLYVVHQGQCDKELCRRHPHKGRFHNLPRALELMALPVAPLVGEQVGGLFE